MSQEHLTAVDAPHDPEPILKLIGEYESAYALAATSDVQDSFYVGALQSLAFDPYPEYLRPVNWRVRRPALDIEVRVTPKNELAIDVLPWVDKVARNGEVWTFDDFVEFPEPSRPGQSPRMTAFTLDLEDLALEVRDPNILDTDTRAIVRRRLVFSCYEFVLKRLAHPFNCRVKTALMCVGPNAQLLVRQTTLLDNPVERANLLSDSSGFRWHGKFLRLCAEFSVTPEDLLGFYRSTLLALEPDVQDRSLREFLGKPVESEEDSWRYRYRRRNSRKQPIVDVKPLLDVLNVFSRPETHPPLSPGDAPDLMAVLADLAKAGERTIRVLADHYQLDEEDVRQFLRDHYPQYLLASLTMKELVAELEKLSDEEGADRDAKAAPLRTALVEGLRAAWSEDADRPYSARMSRLLRRAGFPNQAEGLVWMRTHAPAAADWIVSVKRDEKRRS